MRPKNLSYLKSHEWINIEDDTAIIGITDFAVEQLGELVYLDLPNSGEQVVQGEPFGEVESVKAVSDLISPASGEIIESNQDLCDDLEGLQNNPFDNGWLIKIKLNQKPTELLDADTYEELVQTES
jgi:glycine cleavage system H protein